MVYNVYLIRHAKTEDNRQGRYKGASYEPVSEQGISELAAKMQAGYYPRVKEVYTSPMLRCRQTARLIYTDLDLKVVPGFAEYNFGVFEGKSYQELKDDPAYRKWINSGGRERAPGGEDIQEYKERCCQAFHKAIEDIRQGGSKDTVLVIHGGTIMAVLERHVPGSSFYDWQVTNAEGYKLTIEEDLWQREKIIKSYQHLNDINLLPAES